MFLLALPLNAVACLPDPPPPPELLQESKRELLLRHILAANELGDGGRVYDIAPLTIAAERPTFVASDWLHKQEFEEAIAELSAGGTPIPTFVTQHVVEAQRRRGLPAEGTLRLTKLWVSPEPELTKGVMGLEFSWPGSTSYSLVRYELTAEGWKETSLDGWIACE